MTLNTLTNARTWCLLLAVPLVAGCSRSPDSAKTVAQENPTTERHLLKVGFQLDWYPVAEDGGEYQALVKNYYRDAGLDVTIAPGGPGPHGIQMVATGRMQFSLGPCDDVILAVRQGAPLLIVGAHMQHNPQAVMVHDDSPVKAFRDLDGRSVMAVPGSAWPSYVEGHYGIKLNILPMDYGLARFMSDRNFIQQCFITSEPYDVEIHGAKVRTILIADAGYDPYRVIFTSKAFARDHPDAVRAFVAGTIRGWIDFLHGNDAEARARIQAENSSQSTALMDYTIATMKRYHLVGGDPAKGERMGLITPARMTALVHTLTELKILDVQMPLEKFVRFEFLPPELLPEKT
jgi:NitT/TauT family transport system substrate-binding protein